MTAIHEQLRTAENAPFLRTTLRNLGIEAARDRGMNLAGEEVVVAKFGNAYVVGMPNHPFANSHLTHVLTEVAPVKYPSFDDNVLDITCDFEMPDRAAEQESYSEKLHRIHLGDPDIAEPYREFHDHHRKAWVRAMKSEAGRSLFSLPATSLFVAIETLSEQFLSQYREELLSFSTRPSYKRISAARSIVETSRNLTGGEGFLRFFKEQPDFEGETDSQKIWAEIFSLRSGRMEDLAFLFLEQLPREEWRNFVVGHMFKDESVNMFIDPKQKKVWQKGLEDTTVSFPSKQTVLFSDTQRNSFRVEVFGDGSEPLDWKVTHYEFSDEYKSQALYPLVVWEKTPDGNKRFLTQHEATSLIPRGTLPHIDQSDVFLGRTLAAYFSEGITGKWKRKRGLKGGTYKNEMMGAQVPVLVSMQKHAKSLLWNRSSFYRRIEDSLKFPP